MNIFEEATKKKIRFEHKGLLTVEDLWDLSVEDLDGIFKKVNTQKNTLSQESLLDTPTTENTIVNIQIAIIKYIVASKLADKQASLLAKEKKDKKNKILQILAAKQDNALENKSEEELKEMLESL